MLYNNSRSFVYIDKIFQNRFILENKPILKLDNLSFTDFHFLEKCKNERNKKNILFYNDMSDYLYLYIGCFIKNLGQDTCVFHSDSYRILHYHYYKNVLETQIKYNNKTKISLMI